MCDSIISKFAVPTRLVILPSMMVVKSEKHRRISIYNVWLITRMLQLSHTFYQSVYFSAGDCYQAISASLCYNNKIVLTNTNNTRNLAWVEFSVLLYVKQLKWYNLLPKMTNLLFGIWGRNKTFLLAPLSLSWKWLLNPRLLAI